MSNFDLDELYGHRVLVFIESDNGTFRQVLLTQEQFKKVSNAIVREKDEDVENLRPGFECVWLEIDDDREIPGDTFLGMKSHE